MKQDMPDARWVREKLQMTQIEFAKFLQISPKTLHKWEQKTSAPSGAARTLLAIAQHRPDVIREICTPQK